MSANDAPDVGVSQVESHPARPARKSRPTTAPRSGLRRLRPLKFAMTFVDPMTAREALWELIGADDHTYRCWSCLPRLRLLDAFALHHALDPNRLWWAQSPFASLGGLKDCFQDGEDHPLEHLSQQLHAADRGWRAAHFPLRSQLALDDEVHVEIALEFLEQEAFPVIDFRPPHQPAARTCRHTTPLMVILEEARQLYRTPEEGGRYVPGVHATKPRVDEYLRKVHPELSKETIAQVCHIVRPIELPLGRPPKADSAWD